MMNDALPGIGLMVGRWVVLLYGKVCAILKCGITLVHVFFKRCI